MARRTHPSHRAHAVNSIASANHVHARHASNRRVIEPHAKGQHRIAFHEGGLHASTGTPAGQKISPAKHAEAASGALGPKAKRQEQFYRNVLKG